MPSIIYEGWKGTTVKVRTKETDERSANLPARSVDDDVPVLDEVNKRQQSFKPRLGSTGANKAQTKPSVLSFRIPPRAVFLRGR